MMLCWRLSLSCLGPVSLALPDIASVVVSILSFDVWRLFCRSLVPLLPTPGLLQCSSARGDYFFASILQVSKVTSFQGTDGLFSWRPVDATHRMYGVAEKFQTLLAQLLVGAHGKWTSLDFSNALGIQHNEQQDPNKFARLLFDRMEEPIFNFW